MPPLVLLLIFPLNGLLYSSKNIASAINVDAYGVAVL